MDQYQTNFSEEAGDLIAEMEKCLLQLEGAPHDSGLVQQVFRAMHTLKGNSSMFGFKVIAEFTHHLESIYEFVRTGETKLTKKIVDISFASLDHLSQLIDSHGELNPQNKAAHAKLTEEVVAIVAGIKPEILNNQVAGAEPVKEDFGKVLKTYQIFFKPCADIFYNGTNPVYLIEDLQSLGKCEISLNTDEIPDLHELDPTLCYVSWTIFLQTEAAIGAIREVFIFVEGRCELNIELIVEQDFVEEAIAEIKEMSLSEIKAPISEDNKKKNIISSIRVPSERLDNLMSLVSELMTLQAKLGTLAERNPLSELLAVTENLEKISTRLRDNAFSMCLVPIRNILTPFNRLVRDLADELHKEIEFVTEGVETELDKNIMEGLSDPLMHLLRNSIDHGIEDPETRVKSGKAKHGTIVFRAYCAGTNVYIEIQDDGKGMDPERIRLKAIQKGLISPEENLSDKEILNLIFLPGFSTAEQISEISGRGVGMDVVKRKISDIRGQIKITSAVNVGTTIIIKLPITISIIDGLLVKVNDADFVIPLSAVDRCFEAPTVRNLNRFNNLIVLDSEQIPFINMGEEFDAAENLTGSQEIVLVYFEEKRVALIVDRVVGKFQAVLKPLGNYFRQMENISGATILGDGNIALVLDINKVAEQYLQKKRLAVCQ